jgi:hypothetical protein
MCGGPLQRGGCLIKLSRSSFLDQSSGQIERAIETTQVFNLAEGFRSLAKFGFALQQHPNTVIIPPLPLGNLASWIFNVNIRSAGNGKGQLILGKHQNRELIVVSAFGL